MQQVTISTIPISCESLGLSRKGILEIAGQLPPKPRLAIVGSRAAHVQYLELTALIVEIAGKLGWTLISGGALGIDGAAHRAALQFSVPQLAVLPCGADYLYPPRHHKLFTEILQTTHSGLLFAQPRGILPTRSMFASRNVFIVDLADAVIVVEAASRSGTIQTGCMALRKGVSLAAVVGTPGCSHLISKGAHPFHLVQAEPAKVKKHIAQWLSQEPLDSQEWKQNNAWPAELQWLRDALLRVGPRGLTIDELEEPLLGISALAEAELANLICEIEPGRYILSP